MKNLFTFLISVLITVSVFAQSPQKMSYQAVIRNSSNALVTSTVVGMQISILQGSPTGTLVYSETQTPTTNTNGLVSIEIGGGIGFDTISWSNGPYFIKTETDPLGGTTYTISGTSQLLSVPYALHAKTAETLAGGIIETDPVYSASQAVYITATDITNLSNLSGVNTGDQNGSETNVTSGTNISVTGTGTTTDPYIINSTVATHYIGENYGGGIIFWLDVSGQHGLIAATADNSASIQWYSYNVSTGAIFDGIYAGKTNTNIIINILGAGSYATQVCNDYSVVVNNEYYDDWYLPSKYELNLLYIQKSIVGGFVGISYWSSLDTGGAVWAQDFTNGSQNIYIESIALNVRAIRSF